MHATSETIADFSVLAVKGYWVLGICVYLLKFAIPYWDFLTSYGKLDRGGAADVSCRIGFSEKVAWTSFYGLGLLWNTLLIAVWWS